MPTDTALHTGAIARKARQMCRGHHDSWPGIYVTQPRPQRERTEHPTCVSHNTETDGPSFRLTDHRPRDMVQPASPPPSPSGRASESSALAGVRVRIGARHRLALISTTPVANQSRISTEQCRHVPCLSIDRGTCCQAEGVARLRMAVRQHEAVRCGGPGAGRAADSTAPTLV